jgi:hypothetical protein
MRRQDLAAVDRRSDGAFRLFGERLVERGQDGRTSALVATPTSFASSSESDDMLLLLT